MRNVVIGFLGTKLDDAHSRRRWRPSVDLCRHPEFPVDRLELLHDARFARLAERVAADARAASPDTEVLARRLDLADPWDFEEVYGALFDFARTYGFDEDRERYHVHMTTGTHVGQICWFLLTESRHVPARLLQTGPPRGGAPEGTLDVIDLDLRRYDALQSRFELVAAEHDALLKGGVATRDAAFGALIERVEQVALASDAPILLLGETGTGKTALAERIHALRRAGRRLRGPLVQVPCAALSGERAQAALFGQRRGATGVAGSERAGLLREAHGGTLVLDGVDDLGPAEQALLLGAVETGRFRPLGSDGEAESDFRVIACAGADLPARAADGRFRADLLARLGAWTFRLPPLRERRADLEPLIEHEIARAEAALGQRLGFAADAAAAWGRFARDPGTPWPGNLRELAAAVARLCALAPRGRVTLPMVEREVAELRAAWAAAERCDDARLVSDVLGERAVEVDPFDRAQLAAVVRACRSAPTISAAGRALFAASRERRASRNDADRLRKYLARFELSFAEVADATP